MSSPYVNAAYLAYQYDDSEKLRIRAETHQRYTEGGEDFAAVERRHIDAQPGLRILDVGCGPGRLAAGLRDLQVVYLGLDRSAGLVKEARGRHLQPDDAAGIAFIQGDAQALPLADASVDRAVAIGVFYHLTDWRRALVEMRRVLRPGGRAVISTNGVDAMRRIYDVHREAAMEVGYTPLPYTGSAFNLSHLPDVQAVFPSVERHVEESALVFPDPEPALRFYATNRIDMVEGWAASDAHRARLLPLVRAKIEAIIQREGCFRVPKSYGFFVATR